MRTLEQLTEGTVTVRYRPVQPQQFSVIRYTGANAVEVAQFLAGAGHGLRPRVEFGPEGPTLPRYKKPAWIDDTGVEVPSHALAELVVVADEEVTG